MISNHEMARRYKEKSKLIGKDILDYRLLEDDRVKLIEVLDKEDTGRLVIPSFITEIFNENHVLEGCKYREVYIDNKGELEFNANRLCAYIGSDEIVVKFRHSEKVTDMSGMFYGCNKLRAIDISGINTINVKDMHELFAGCNMLKDIVFGDIDTSKVIDMSSMFSWCRSLIYLDLSKFNISWSTDVRYILNKCSKNITIKVGKHGGLRVIEGADLDMNIRFVM